MAFSPGRRPHCFLNFWWTLPILRVGGVGGPGRCRQGHPQLLVGPAQGHAGPSGSVVWGPGRTLRLRFCLRARWSQQPAGGSHPARKRDVGTHLPQRPPHRGVGRAAGDRWRQRAVFRRRGQGQRAGDPDGEGERQTVGSSAGRQGCSQGVKRPPESTERLGAGRGGPASLRIRVMNGPAEGKLGVFRERSRFFARKEP